VRSRTTATYVYCVVQSDTPPDLAGAPEGLPGTSPPRLLPLAAGLWAVAADAPLPEYGGEAIDAHLSDLDWVGERALAHEQVVEHFAASHPVLPMKLFTLFSGDERAAARLLERQEEVGRILARLAGRVEWGVRVLFQDAKARQVALAEGAEAAKREGPAASGRSFLLRKKAEQEGARDLARRARAEADRAYEELARHAVAARRREPGVGGDAETGARLLLDAAFLVPKDGGIGFEGGFEDGFEGAVHSWADHLAGHGCELTLTGPWPPYNFIEEPA
jgi:Gas vesicle synthesis protein GvpL/GvpF